jgi:hypothetical protein
MLVEKSLATFRTPDLPVLKSVFAILVVTASNRFINTARVTGSSFFDFLLPTPFMGVFPLGLFIFHVFLGERKGKKPIVCNIMGGAPTVLCLAREFT